MRLTYDEDADTWKPDIDELDADELVLVSIDFTGDELYPVDLLACDYR